MKIALLLISAALSILHPFECLGSELTSLSSGKNEVQIEHDGQSRRLIVTTPKTFNRQSASPILFCFHGAGGRANGISDRWSPQADKHGLIVISAEAIRPLAKWNFKDNFHAKEYDDVGFISKVVEILIKNKIADEKAVFATGHSSGGLFSYRLAKETDLFAAVSPMSCGMAMDAHEPDKKTKPIPIIQVIGDKDKSYNGSTSPQITMYSAKERIEIWRKFNQCGPDPVIVEEGDEIVVYTYASPSGLEVVLCKVKDQEHHIRKDLRDRGDSIAIEFLLKHKRK
jgi:polyhydroxybutyrate depolymerase